MKSAARWFVLLVLGCLLAGAQPAEAAALVIHYRTTWTAPRIHFDAGSGWTTPPGVRMTSEGAGWWRYTVPAGAATFVFNDGDGTWDNHSGMDYRAAGPSVWVVRGQTWTARPEVGLVEEVVGPRGRRLSVYLPPSYDRASTRRYPVLYLLDGQNLFDPYAMHGGWDAARAADERIAARTLAPLILVGVWNSPARMEEYTFVPDSEYGGGGGGEHLDFLLDEVKPFVDRRWHTRRTAEDTGIGGSSLGGLFALEAGLSRPDRFRRVLAMSPSLWWADRDLVGRLESATPPRPPLRIYLDAGDQNDGLEDTLAAREALLHWGFTEGRNLTFAIGRGHSHNEIAWRQRLPDALEALFPAR